MKTREVLDLYKDLNLLGRLKHITEMAVCLKSDQDNYFTFVTNSTSNETLDEFMSHLEDAKQ